jgi:hypothetical protein
MLIQTADRAWARRCAEERGYFPRAALDLWWRAARRTTRRAGARELLAMRLLDHWRWHATFRLGSRLVRHDMIGFLDTTGAKGYSRALDRISVAPLAAMSVYRVLRANFTGRLLDVYRSSTGTSTSINPTASKVLDVEALLNWVGVGTGTVQEVSDQGPNAWHYRAEFAGNRPTIVASSVLQTSTGGVPTMLFDGASDNLVYPSSLVPNLGLTGTPAREVAVVAKLSGGYYIGNIGHGNADKGWRFGASATECFMDTSPGSDRVYYSGADSTTKERAFHFVGGGTSHAGTITQDGVLLPFAFTTGNNDIFSLQNASTRWGAVSQTTNTAAGFMAGRSNMIVYFSVGANLGAGDRNELLIEQSKHL